MASQLVERFLRPRLPEAKTLADDHSHHGGPGTTSSLRASSGSPPNTTSCPLTVDTTGPSRFGRFDTICDRSSRVDIRVLRGWIAPAPGIAIGAAAWSGYLLAIPLSLVVLLLLGQIETRRQALALMAAYYAGATWQVIPGAATFFGHHDNVLEALLLWLALSFMLALPWAALWSGKPKTRLCPVP